LTWQTRLGGSSGGEIAESVGQTTDGGYVVVGSTVSNDGNVTGNHGGVDYWLVKLDGSGNLEWQKALGGTDSEVAHSVEPTNDGGYVVAGFSWSDDGDVTANHGLRDFWVVKLNPSISTGTEEFLEDLDSIHVSVFPNPTNGKLIVSSENSPLETLLIMDGKGRVVLQKNLNSNSVSVDLKNHPEGVYLITARTLHTTTAKRIALKH